MPAGESKPTWDQKSLRSQFLDSKRRDFSTTTLDAVAHMILEIDRSERVMEVGLAHLARMSGAGRVDIGFGDRRAKSFSACAEFLRDRGQRTSIVGVPLPNENEVLQRVWKSVKPVAYDDVANNSLVASLRNEFEAVESKAMLAKRLDHGGKPFGLVCVDDLDQGRTWSDFDKAFVHRFCDDFFAPILHIHRRLTAAKRPDKPSPAELDAIRLAARGLRFKEIARALGKSVRTIEFQLRNARQKTGAANIVELVRRCEPWLD